MSCTHCTAATKDHLALCKRCQTTLSVALVNVGAYYGDLGRVRPGERVKARSAYRSTPPPGATPQPDRITRALDEARADLVGWVRILVDDRPEHAPGPKDAPSDYTQITSITTWLEERISSIVTLEWAAELLRDALRLERRLLKLVEQSDTGWYAGVCGAELEPEWIHDEHTCACLCHQGSEPCDIEGGCGEPGIVPATSCERGLYATTGTTWIRCPDCGATWDVSQRREVLMREARDRLAPVSVIAKTIVGLLEAEVSVAKLANRIDQWVSRGKLRDLGVRVLEDGRPHRVYRVGDIFDLMKLDVQPSEEEAC